MKYYNHLVDIAFSIDTPIDKFENIPVEELILALKRRVNIIAQERSIDSFAEVGDRYEYELPPTEAARTTGSYPGA